MDSKKHFLILAGILVFLTSSFLSAKHYERNSKQKNVISREDTSFTSFEAIINYVDSLLVMQRSSQAITALHEWVSSYQGDTLTKQYAYCHLLFGKAYLNLGYAQKADVHLKRNLAILKPISAKEVEIARTQILLADANASMNKHEEVIGYSKKAIEKFREANDRVHLALAYANLGDYFSRQSQKKLAMYYGNLASDVLDKTSNISYEDQIDIETILGGLYVEEVKEKALDHYKNALNASNQILGNEVETGWASGRLGWFYLSLNNYEKAVEYIQKGLNELEPVYGDQSVFIGHFYLSLGESYIKMGQVDSAKKYLDRTSAIYLNADSNYYWMESVYRQYGKLYEAKGKDKKALEYYHKALYQSIPELPLNKNIFSAPELKYCKDKEITRFVFGKKASLFRKLFQQTGKTKYLEASLKFVSLEMDYNLDYCFTDFIHENQLNQTLIDQTAHKSGLLFANLNDLKSNNAPEYNDYVKKMYSKLARTEGFLLKAKEKQARLYDSDRADSVFQIIQIKKQKIKQLERIIADNNAIADSLKEKKRRLADLYMELFINEKKIAAYKENMDSSFNNYVYNTEEIMQQLNKQDIVLDYFLNDSSIYIFAVDHENIHFYQKDIDARFYRLLKNYLKTLDQASSLNKEYKKKLSDYLIDPVYHHLTDKEKLVVIPDNQLSQLPFETLLIPGEDKMLVNKFQLSYHVLPSMIQPEILRDTKRFAAFAPGFRKPANAVLTSDNVLMADSAFQHEKIIHKKEGELISLPNTIKEVKHISTQAEKSGLTSRVFINDQASESNFKKVLPTYDILHLATHIYISPDIPALSGLFFAQKNGAEDGYLYMHEIYNLTSQADLLVMSRNMNRGKNFSPNDGALSFARGFISAGIPNILVPLWRVEEDKAEALIRTFYKHLFENDDVEYAEALQQAKLDCIKEGWVQADWAGFVLISY